MRGPNPAFWTGKRVFLTGHTGFKGAWLQLWLERMGAKVIGYALAPDAEPSLYGLVAGEKSASETIADIRDGESLARAMRLCDPEIIIHFAAQSLVRRSYARPVETFDVNVMGTVQLLEAARQASSLSVVLIVTTDKVYSNDESGRHFREDDRLGGHDPYSASKAACELAVASFRRAFFDAAGIRVAAARAGNVLGGGDFSEDRLVPDVVRAALRGESPDIRSPMATRPWQHVLDCLSGYLQFIEAHYEKRTTVEALNFGPPFDEEACPVRTVVAAVQQAMGLDRDWREVAPPPRMREMQTLGLDPSLAASVLGWRTSLSQIETIEWTARWYDSWRRGLESRALTLGQIDAFMARF
jgi:CDP-glucose 4,6-dehydratase